MRGSATPWSAHHRRHLLVCVGECCPEDGMNAAELVEVGRTLTAAGLLCDGPLRVEPSRVSCLGACRSGAVLCVQREGVWYYSGSPEHMDWIIEQHLIGGRMVEDLVFHFGPALEATQPDGSGQPQGPSSTQP